MKTSSKGIDFIKSFETLRLKAYKAVKSEKYYTIGYGHYGPDVEPGMEITFLLTSQFLPDQHGVVLVEQLHIQVFAIWK